MKICSLMRRAVLLLAAWLAWTGASAQGTVRSEGLRQQQKLNLICRYLERLYVDEVEMQPLVEAAIRGMLGELDPHSAYLDAEEMSQAKAGLDGEFSGIGVEFNILRDTVIVVNTIAGGPAEKVGVLPNDRIVRIDSVDAVGFRQTDVPKYLRGKTGSRVSIEVVRHGERSPLHFGIVRDRIPLNTVDAAYRLDDRNGYIKVNRFGRTTMAEFREAFASLGSVEGLLLDLRGNGGGLFDQAIEMAGFFLPAGAAIVSTEGRAVTPVSVSAPRDGDFVHGGVVVLIDENSASASEIVAGALQDWDRAVIVGRPSFGKGLVQRQVTLGDGSALRLTVARYHTPSGRVIQRPYEKGNARQYYIDHYKLMDEAVRDSLNASAPRFRTLRTGRTVLGGGGIMPDVVTKADTTGVTEYLLQLVRRGVLGEFTLSYLDRHRDELVAAYPDFATFEERFEVTDAILDELAAAGRERGVEPDAEQMRISAAWLRRQIRAVLAQKLFTTAEFYRVVNGADSVTFGRAAALLRDWNGESRRLLEHDRMPSVGDEVK